MNPAALAPPDVNFGYGPLASTRPLMAPLPWIGAMLANNGAYAASVITHPPQDSWQRQQAQPEISRMPAYTPPLSTQHPSSLRIIYNNDPHEKFKALPHLVNAFFMLSRQGEQAGKDVLRLNAGDNNIGREPDEWKLNVQLLNRIGYHAVTMGNHELDLGTQAYAKGLRAANFPTLVANLNIPPSSDLATLAQQGQWSAQPKIVQSPHGAYGLIGLTTPELRQVVSSRVKTQGESPMSFEETVRITQAQVHALQQQGIQKIVVLSHLGYEQDRQLAQRVAGIDVIVGGHSHHTLNGIQPGVNYLKSPTNEPVLLLQAGKNAQNMGVADVRFDLQGRIIPEQNQLMNPFAYAADPGSTLLRNATLGTPRVLATLLNAYDADGNEFKADAVAQMAADQIRRSSQADIAFVRSPELRNNFSPGPVTDQDLKALMPFDDPIVRLPLTGAEILGALQRAAQGLRTRETHPGMLHPSGMSVRMNASTGKVEQAWVLNRQTQQWEPLNPNQTYRVALGEFSVTNREFPEISHPERVDWHSGQSVRQFFWQALQRAGAPQVPIRLVDDGRLQIQGEPAPLNG